MAADPSQPSFEDLERQYGIPAETFCGLSAEEMSRAIVAHDGGPCEPGSPVGYNPIASPQTRLGWLRDAFGPTADVERIRLQLQFFHSRISRTITVDWMLPLDAFERQVADGLRQHFPELGDDARRVITGNYSYSAK